MHMTILKKWYGHDFKIYKKITSYIVGGLKQDMKEDQFSGFLL